MKKIYFNDRYGQTKAVLEGRKTMMRRIIKGDYENIVVLPHGSYIVGYNGSIIESSAVELHSSYQIGEEVAVAQPYKDVIHSLDWVNRILYQDTPGWNNKRFVKADLMPHRIRITDIKVERLQDISEEDCIREGVEKWMDSYIVPGIMEYGKNNVCFDTPREAFAALIDRISGKGTWERNPWVFAYEFELIQ